MGEAHDLPVFGLHFGAFTGGGFAAETFTGSKRLKANGESLALQHFAPAHTDTDIYILFEKGNVIHMGDTFFNGFYPYIDSSRAGRSAGMIAAADKIWGWPVRTRRSFRGMAAGE